MKIKMFDVHRACLAVVLVLLNSELKAQDKSNFSGSWVLESESPEADTPRVLSISQSLVRTDARGEPMKPYFKDITVSRTLVTGTRTETYQIGVVGGVVPGFRQDGTRNGPGRHHAVWWDADALVVEDASYTGSAPETGVWAERREVWSIDPNGRLRLVITSRGSTDVPRTVTLVYRPS